MIFFWARPFARTTSAKFQYSCGSGRAVCSQSLLQLLLRKATTKDLLRQFAKARVHDHPSRKFAVAQYIYILII